MTRPQPQAEVDHLVEAFQVEAFIRSGRAGLIPWSLRFLPHLFHAEPAPFHWEIAEVAESGDNAVIAAPRGHAKSTLLALAFPLFRAACWKEPFTLLISDTADQAGDRTSDIYAELLDNIELTTVYPHLALPEAKDYQTQRVKKSTREFVTVGGIRMTSAGAGKSLRGLREREDRPTLIIADDLENDESVLTEYQREKIYSWFHRALLNLPGPEGARILVIGNILHQEALMAKLLKPDKADEWTQRIYRAILPDGSPLWPAYWSLDRLEARRRQIGSRAFTAEFLNDPEDDTNALFKVSWLEANRRLAHPPLARVAVAIDPSASTDGDAAGIVAGGLDARGHGYVLEDVTTQGSPMTWARVALETYWRLQADEIVAERNNGGEMILTTLMAALRPGEVMPPVRLVWASRGKTTRAEPVAALVENGKVHLVDHLPKLERELTTWIPGMPSPNRLDAFVWLVTGLMIDAGATAGELFLGWAG